MSKTELRKALTTTGDGAALLPYDLDPVLHEELLALQPLTMLLDILPAGGKTHEYSVRSSHPYAWFEGETTSAQNQNSVYARKAVILKILRQWGSVSGFSRAMDEKFIDNFVAELEGAVEGMSNTIEYGALHGCDDQIGFTGDAYQYNGVLPLVYKYAPANVIDAGGNKIILGDLDDALAKCAAFRGVARDPKLWLMGLGMKNVIDGLQTAVQIPLRSAELFDGKLNMATYANVPIFETDYLVPESSTSSPTVSGHANSGGSLADDQYFYMISSVTQFGEQIAGVEGNVTTSGSTNTAHLTWTHDNDAKLYMIWRGLSTGGANLKLLDIIPALTYNADGSVLSVVESYLDDGTKTPVTGVKPLLTGEQIIVCINRNPKRGVAFLGKVDDMGREMNNLFSYVELARIKDTYDFMLKGYMALRLVHPNLVSVIRHVKLS